MSVYSASIDDNDPAMTYSPDWVLITSDGSWTGTMHSTSILGASASFRFTGKCVGHRALKYEETAHAVRLGSRVAIICIIPTGNSGASTRATVSIDGGAAVSVSHVTTGPVQYGVVLWDSGPLPLKNHLVTLTNAGTEDYLRFDRVDYDPTDGNAPTTSYGTPSHL